MSVLIETVVCLPISTESKHRPFVRSMSSSGLTSAAQLQYILQWFQEFSEYQREDFLPVLAAAHGDKADQLATTITNLSCQDKPVSLFQCRIKLFNEWYPTWSIEEKERLVKEITDIDLDFSNKLQEAVTKESHINGDVNDLAGNDEKNFAKCEETSDNIEEEAQHNDEIAFPSPSEDNISIEITAAS